MGPAHAARVGYHMGNGLATMKARRIAAIAADNIERATRALRNAKGPPVPGGPFEILRKRFYRLMASRAMRGMSARMNAEIGKLAVGEQVELTPGADCNGSSA